jgi:acetyl-CoA carboxylase biotin carboxyl carrier protein
MAEPDKKAGAERPAAKAAGKASETPASGPPEGATVGQSPETASLLGLIDKLSGLLERSELVELEVEAGETGIVLRKPAAPGPLVVETAAVTPAEAAPPVPTPAEVVPTAADVKVVRAPLTGIFYAAPSPTAPPYVSAGQHVTTGQVIGLIEAMKLFNEIKSDVTGRVVRIVAESGKLVKTKQPLIEVEP